MRFIEEVLVSTDEEYGFVSRVAEHVKDRLEDVHIDTYNEQYVFRFTLEKVDKTRVSDPELEEGD